MVAGTAMTFGKRIAAVARSFAEAQPKFGVQRRDASAHEPTRADSNSRSAIFGCDYAVDPRGVSKVEPIGSHAADTAISNGGPVRKGPNPVPRTRRACSEDRKAIEIDRHEVCGDLDRCRIRIGEAEVRGQLVASSRIECHREAGRIARRDGACERGWLVDLDHAVNGMRESRDAQNAHNRCET